jgi:enediyne biosynthesis protein E3
MLAVRQTSPRTAARLRLFGIGPEQASFERRGFPDASPAKKARLEAIGRTFVHGHRAALRHDIGEGLEAELESIAAEHRGFAYEGAAMATVIRDLVSPLHRGRWDVLLARYGERHIYMLHVGAGWALARTRWPMGRFLGRQDPLLRWLVLDGYGFHEGYFRPVRFFRGAPRAAPVPGYGARAFDQGLGRSLWFFAGANVDHVIEDLVQFDERRAADVWSGIGLAAAYAGGCDREELVRLCELAGAARSCLAQGVVFAAAARHRAGNPCAGTELACEVIVGTSADAAAALAERTREDIPIAGDMPAYEVWRTRLRAAVEVTAR